MLIAMTTISPEEPGKQFPPSSAICVNQSVQSTTTTTTTTKTLRRRTECDWMENI